MDSALVVVLGILAVGAVLALRISGGAGIPGRQFERGRGVDDGAALSVGGGTASVDAWHDAGGGDGGGDGGGGGE